MNGRRVTLRFLRSWELALVADNRVPARLRLSPTRHVPGRSRGLVTLGSVLAAGGDGPFQTLPLPAPLPEMVGVDAVVGALRRPLG